MSAGTFIRPDGKEKVTGSGRYTADLNLTGQLHAKLRYADLLKVFWENHDPTQLNRQGPDWGTQYRSAIFFHTPEQQAEAQASKESLEKAHRYSKPIATQIVPAVTFYPAEDYHQQYLEKRGMASCHIKA